MIEISAYQFSIIIGIIVGLVLLLISAITIPIRVTKGSVDIFNMKMVLVVEIIFSFTVGFITQVIVYTII